MTRQHSPKHHDGPLFRNPDLDGLNKSLLDVFKMRWYSNWAKHEQLAHEVPIVETNLEAIHAPTKHAQITWIGHSTFLIQIDGKNILTDPVFSQRASPIRFAGPKRYTKPGIALTDLPKIDYVVLSHNHYDHLDLETARALGNETLWLVPLGNAVTLNTVNITNVVELDWWDEYAVGPLLFVCTPAQHWSARSLFDRCRSLWSGWAITHGEKSILFAGDTGYNPTIFKEIGSRFGPFELALIPIGAYEPRWFMKPMHINPTEAVQLHMELRAKRSFAMHWGTFPLTAEAPGDPPRHLAQARAAKNLPDQEFETLAIGETRHF